MTRERALTDRSVEVICSLQEKNGGFLATTVDDAYPFVYPRDASFMTMALNLHGLVDRSEKFYEFLSGVRRPDGEIYQRYNLGFPYVTRRKEADVTPIVIQGVYDTFRSSGKRTFLEKTWRMVAEGAEFILGEAQGEVRLIHTTCSIHENQTLEEGFEIWANCAAVRGLLDASRIAEVLGQVEYVDKWQKRASILWKAINEKLYDQNAGIFIKTLRGDGSRINAPDVAQLAPFYFGLSQDAELLRRTLDCVRDALWNPRVGGVNRFRDFEIVKDWHWYTGGTGATWPLFTLWLARFYRKLGETEKSEECISFVKKASTDCMEIPEKVAPLGGYKEWKQNETEYNERIVQGIAKAERSKIAIPEYIAWACPLGWSHAEFLLLEENEQSIDPDVLNIN